MRDRVGRSLKQLLTSVPHPWLPLCLDSVAHPLVLGLAELWSIIFHDCLPLGPFSSFILCVSDFLCPHWIMVFSLLGSTTVITCCVLLSSPFILWYSMLHWLAGLFHLLSAILPTLVSLENDTALMRSDPSQSRWM